MKKSSISVLLVTVCFGLYLSLVLYAVPNNGNLKISPTGEYCINEIQQITGTWSPVSGDWKAVLAVLKYQNTRNASDEGSVRNDGSTGSVSIPLGSNVGHYDLSLSVTYKCGNQTIVVNKMGNVCIVDIAYIDGGGKTYCVKAEIDFTAEPAPNACDFPANALRWEKSKKNNNSYNSWTPIAGSQGKEIMTLVENDWGFFKVRAKCGNKGVWVESEEFIVVKIKSIKAGYKVGNKYSKVILGKSAPFIIDVEAELLPKGLTPEQLVDIKWLYKERGYDEFNDGPNILETKISVPIAGEYFVEASCDHNRTLDVFIVDKIIVKDHVRGVVKGDAKELLTKIIIKGGDRELPDDMRDAVNLKINSIKVGLNDVAQKISNGIADVKFKTKDVIASELNKAVTKINLSLFDDGNQILSETRDYTTAIVDKIDNFDKKDFLALEKYDMGKLINILPVGADQIPEINSGLKFLFSEGLKVIDNGNNNHNFGDLTYLANSYRPTLNISNTGTPKIGDGLIKIVEGSSLWSNYDGLKNFEQNFTTYTAKLVEDMTGFNFTNPWAIDHEFGDMRIEVTPLDGKFTMKSTHFDADFKTDITDPENIFLRLKSDKSTVFQEGLANAKFDFGVESENGEVKAEFSSSGNIGKTFRFGSMDAIENGSSTFNGVSKGMVIKFKGDFKTKIFGEEDLTFNQKSNSSVEFNGNISANNFGVDLKSMVKSSVDANIDTVNSTIELDASVDLYFDVIKSDNIDLRIYNSTNLNVRYEDMFLNIVEERYELNTTFGLESAIFKKKAWELKIKNEVKFKYSNFYNDIMEFSSTVNFPLGARVNR